MFYISALFFTILSITVAGSTLPPLQKAIASPISSLPQDSPIPGGSPLQYCSKSRSTDLYSIDRIEVWPQPLYIEDIFEVHLYGAFSKNLTANATWTLTARYADVLQNESVTWDFCDWHNIEQPNPNRKTQCPPEKGFAFIKMFGYVMRMFIGPTRGGGLETKRANGVV
ncbi:MAG: hypothetical protein Q9160_008483 [Pyrenula sp. 1 TL-2023]